MNTRQFLRLMRSHQGHRGCLNGDGHCKRREEDGPLWWAITIRGGKTFVGETCCQYGPDEEFFVLRTENNDNGGNEFLASILIEEIVAIEEIEKPQSAAEAPSHELTSLRKEVGRLYGIIKDMEKGG